MNVLVINTDSDSVISDILNFFLNVKDIEFIVVLNLGITAKTPVNLPLDINYSDKVHSLDLNSNDAKQINSIVDDLFFNFKTFSYMIYLESIPKMSPENFDTFPISDFKNFFIAELQKKITLFQILIKNLKDFVLNVRIFVLIPELAQTKFITENIAESILLSSFHMITTAIADEFIDYHINCNAVVQTSHYLETLSWLLNKADDLPHGKLFQDKKIIDW